MSKQAERKPIEPPASTPEYMHDAWASCLQWAITTPEIRQAFERDTGHMAFTVGTSPIERMIDEATGIHYDYLKEFAKWHDENIWGNLGVEQ